MASSDPRFLRLARFLLGGRDFEVEELTTPERLPEAVLEPSIDIAVLDGADAVADAFRTANATRARRPEIPVIIAADTGGKSPSGVRVFDRWNETEELLLDVERLLSESAADGRLRQAMTLRGAARRAGELHSCRKPRR